MSDKNSYSRIEWLDSLRVLACFLVVMAHIVVPYFMRPPLLLDDSSFLWSSFYASLVRFAVPLFFMVSGALILPVTQPTGMFLKRRFSRVLTPFLIWSVLYAAFPWSYEVLTGNDFKVLFPYSRVIPDLPTMWNNILLIPFNFSVGIHLWFIYVLLGLYLFVPIISPWVEKAGKRQFHYFLVLWGVTLLMPYLQLHFPNLMGKCSWNDYPAFYYFSGYLGYMLLGCYFRRFYDISIARTLAWAVPCFVAGLWFTLHFYRISSVEGQAPNGTYISFASINVALMAGSVFAVFKVLPQDFIYRKAGGLIRDFSKLSFGVFLVHFFLVGMFYRSFAWLDISPFFKIPFLTILTCATGYIIMKLISYIPGSKHITG